MKKSKKYDCRVVQGENGWTADILRRKTAKQTVVSKSRTGFADEAEAQKWCEAELKEFLQQLDERNKRRSRQREK